MRKSAGFTLIELLIVIAIVGILAALILASLGVAKQKARDTSRLAALKQVGTAVDLHYDATGHYPISIGWATACDHPGANWVPDGTNYTWSDKYVLAMPRDPSENCAAPAKHAISYQSDGSTYKVSVQLEGSKGLFGLGGGSNQTVSWDGSSFAATTVPLSATLSSSAASPTGNSPIPITAVFSSNVTDFSAASFSVQNGVVSGINPAPAVEYSFVVTPNGDGEVVLTLPSSAVHDQNGGTNQNPVQFSITYDSSRPHLALSPAPLPLSVTGPFQVSVNSTLPLSDFVAGAVAVQNGAVSDFASQNASNYTFTVTPTAPGTVAVSVPDSVAHSTAGKPNVASNVLTTSF